MKIIDKIVTQVTQPQQTNVLWHNPETGELKIFGNKGWEVVGGNPGEGNSSSTDTNGYPIVTVKDNFNITAEPNTFYDIRNTKDTVINIEMDTNIYSTSYTNQSYYCFSGVSSQNDFMMIMSICGGTITPDVSIEGFKYKMHMYSGFVYGQDMDVFLSDLPTNGGTIVIRVQDTEASQDLTVSNISLQDVGEYIVFAQFNDPDMGLNAQVPIYNISEVENDREDYKYKYSIGGILQMMQAPYGDGNAYMYTNDPYMNAAIALIPFSGCSGQVTYIELPITAELVKTITYNNLPSTNEFVFNFNSPTSINFNQVIKWNNNSVPDLTNSGTYTFSILNGIGCFTFIKL